MPILLNLKQLGAAAANAQKTLEFDHNLDLSAVKLWGEHPFLKPVNVTGSVESRSMIFTIRYIAFFEMSGRCSRCLVPINREIKQEFEHIVLEKIEDEETADGIILAPDGELDLDELVISDILLQFSGIMLCDEQCCGLCPKCGKNLNEGECGCVLHEPDPRFDVLRKLLEEDSD